MAAIHLSNPVKDLYGVGPAAEEKLAKLDIYTIYDLIAFIPWRYDDWSHVGTIGSFDMTDRFVDSTGFDLSFNKSFGKRYEQKETLKFLRKRRYRKDKTHILQFTISCR